MLWLLWKVYHNWVVYRKIQKHWFLKEENGPGEPDAKSLGTDSKNTIHSVYATSSKYPWKERTIAWKNTSQKSSSAKSLRHEIRGPAAWRDWKTTAMRPKQGMNLGKNIFKLKEKDKATLYSPAEEWALPAAERKEREEREFVVDSGACMHMVSEKDFNSAERDHEDIEESDDGDDGQRRGANQRRSHGKCHGHISQSYASWRNSRSSFLGETLWGHHGYTYHWTQRPKTTSHQKGQENQLQYIELWAICGSCFIGEFFLIYTHVNRYTENPVQEKSGSMSGYGENRCHKLAETENIILEKENTKKNRAIHYMTCRTGCRISEKFWSMNVVL